MQELPVSPQGLSRWNLEVWRVCVCVVVWLLHHWYPLKQCSTYDLGQSAGLFALISPLLEHTHTPTHTHTHPRAVRCTNSCDRITELSSSTVPFLSPVLENWQNWPQGDMAAWQSCSRHPENTQVPCSFEYMDRCSSDHLSVKWYQKHNLWITRLRVCSRWYEIIELTLRNLICFVNEQCHRRDWSNI